MKTRNQIIILMVISALGYLGWQNQDKIPFLGQANKVDAPRKRGERAVAVLVATAKVRDLPEKVTAVGTLRANRSINLTAKVTAKIKRLTFADGAEVKRGDPLVYLDDTETRAEAAESLAAYGNSRKLYQRALKLYKSGNAPKARVDLLLSEMQVEQAKVSADKARLAEYVISAPFSGIVGFREVSEGALVRPGDVITTLDDITRLKLDFNLPELNLAQVRKGQIFKTKSVAYEGRIFEGVVETVSSRVDPVTRVVRVRGIIDNDSRELKPGMFLSVSLQTGTVKNAVLVPEQSVIVTPAGHFVFKIEKDITKRTAVQVGQTMDGWVHVLSGVSGGDILITEGLQKVRDGRKVKIVSDEAVRK